jgi:hypothetical protein
MSMQLDFSRLYGLRQLFKSHKMAAEPEVAESVYWRAVRSADSPMTIEGDLFAGVEATRARPFRVLDATLCPFGTMPLEKAASKSFLLYLLLTEGSLGVGIVDMLVLRSSVDPRNPLKKRVSSAANRLSTSRRNWANWA